VVVAAGTFSGGWRVIRTLGTKVTDIAAPQGFSAETASSTTILASSYFGFSLSTTQVVSGGVMGAGLGRRGGVVHWSVVKRMVAAWILTMPAAALVGAVSEETISASPTDTSGVVFVALVAAIVLAFIFRMSRRSSVTADNVIDDLPVVELPVQQPEMVPA
jgi:PiT family inorganic phosphate transporter